MSAESDFPPPSPEPTRALLLAQALEACLETERRVPGSAAQVIARQPAWARTELRRMVDLALSLEAVAADAVMSDEFRVAARARLMRRISGNTLAVGPWAAIASSAHASAPKAAPRHRRRWLMRGGAGGVLAAALLTAATLSASASALPGDPFYAIKQAREELGVRFAPDDQTRAMALLRQANARLDETARLLQEGRTDAVAQTTQQYDDALSRATSTYVVTITVAPAPEDPSSDHIETAIVRQQEQLQLLLETAPEPARADLRQALVATQRSRALVAADTKPVQTARGESTSHAGEVADAPITVVAAEVIPTDMPTNVPTNVPTARPRRSVPPPVDIVAARPEPTDVPPVVAEDNDNRGPSRGDPPALARHAPAATTRRDRAPSVEDHQQSDDPPQVAVTTSVAGPADKHTSDSPTVAQADDRPSTPPPGQAERRGRDGEEPQPQPLPMVAVTRQSSNADAHADTPPGRTTTTTSAHDPSPSTPVPVNVVARPQPTTAPDKVRTENDTNPRPTTTTNASTGDGGAAQPRNRDGGGTVTTNGGGGNSSDRNSGGHGGH